MVTAFANLKGGVGKSTLCLLLAEWWAGKELRVKTVDTDYKQTLCMFREEDLRRNPQATPPFDIGYMSARECSGRMKELRRFDGQVLIDLPMPADRYCFRILEHADVVLVPFQYDRAALEATSRFAWLLDRMKEKENWLDRRIIFIPNAVSLRCDDPHFRTWTAWEAAIRSDSLLAPQIPAADCFHSPGSLGMDGELEPYVEECFRYVSESAGIRVT